MNTIPPLEPRPPEVYETSHADIEADLDLICWSVDVADCIKRALCDHFGEDFYDEPVTNDPAESFGEASWKAVNALIHDGFLILGHRTDEMGDAA